MIPALHLIMIVASASSLCCVLGNRRTRSVTAVGGTVLMAAAMADLALGLVGLAPLIWTLILVCWAMVAAGAARVRQGRSAAAQTGALPVTALTIDGPLDTAAAGRRHLHLLHQLGLVVVAGQIALCAAMAGGADSSPGAGAGLPHPHTMSVFVAVVCVAGALFVVAAAAMVLAGQRSRSERGNLLSMSVMAAAMAVMPFG